MQSAQVVKIPEVTEYLDKNFDHVERIQKHRFVSKKDKRTGRVTNYKEYLVHCEPGEYEGVLVFKNKDGVYEMYVTTINVYRRANTYYFIHKVPNDENKELVFVYLKRLDN